MTLGILIYTIIFIAFLWLLVSKTKNYFENSEVLESYTFGRILQFNLINNGDKDIKLNLCELNEDSQDYSFTTSDGNYKKLQQYLKSYNLFVIDTKVRYENSDWQKDIITLESYNPFGYFKKPILIAMDFEQKSVYQKIIHSNIHYDFNYFSSLIINLKPFEKKEISLLIVEEKENNNSNEEKENIKTGIIIKNNTDEKKRIKLFENNDFNNVEIQSLFEQNNYDEIVKFYKSNNLICREIKIHSKYEKITYKLNFDEETIDSNVVNENNENNYYYIIDLKEPTFIAIFELDVEKNCETIITFK